MKKVFFLLAIFLFACQDISADNFTFKKATDQEAIKIEENLNLYYAEQLIIAGLFGDLNVAIQMVESEAQQGNLDGEKREFNYYHIFLEEHVIGYLVFSTGKNEIHVDALYLEKASRGLGYGKKILQELETKILSSGQSYKIKLFVFHHNEIAFNLYLKMGYQIEEIFYQEEKIIGYQMKKDLCNPVALF